MRQQLSLFGPTFNAAHPHTPYRQSRTRRTSLGLSDHTNLDLPCQDSDTLALGSYYVAQQDLSIHTGTVHLQRWSAKRKQPRKYLVRRKSIQAFSSPARRRLMLMIARIDPRPLSQPLWITLTVHESHQVDLRHVITAFDVWLHRVKRKYPDVQYIWRLALQDRGAPHIHVILWRPVASRDHLTAASRRWFGQSWHAVADPESIPHGLFGAKVEIVKSWRRIRTYIAKYIAEEHQPLPQEYRGKRWGRSAGLPLTCLLTCTPSKVMLNYVRRIVRSWLRAHVKRRRWAARYLSGHRSADVMVPAVVPLRALQAAINSGLPPPDDLNIDLLPDLIAQAEVLALLEARRD